MKLLPACPNCKTKLLFFKVAFNWKKKAVFHCYHCQKTLHNISATNNAGMAGSLMAMALAAMRKDQLHGDTKEAVYNLLGILGLSVGFACLQYFTASIIIAKEQIPPSFKKKYLPPKNPTRLEFLKYKYQDKSDYQLNHIIKSIHMTPKAKTAAKEVLAERRAGKL